MQPAQRLADVGKPEGLSSLTAFLASHEAADITASTYVVDGGLMRNYNQH